jgi:hypothetical protein
MGKCSKKLAELKDDIVSVTNQIVYEVTNQLAQCYKNRETKPVEAMYVCYAERTNHIDETNKLKQQIKELQKRKKMLTNLLKKTSLSSSETSSASSSSSSSSENESSDNESNNSEYSCIGERKRKSLKQSNINRFSKYLILKEVLLDPKINQYPHVVLHNIKKSYADPKENMVIDETACDIVMHHECTVKKENKLNLIVNFTEALESLDAVKESKVHHNIKLY